MKRPNILFAFGDDWGRYASAYRRFEGDRTPNAAALGQLLEETVARGLLIGKGGLHGNCVRISPALTVTADEIDEALTILGEALAAMKA